MSRSFLFLLASARPEGNSRLLAEAAAAQLPGTYSRRWIDLAALSLPAYVDGRHAPGGHTPVSADEALLHEATLGATDLVVVSPLYWYALSSYAKTYLDHWSKWLRTPDPAFREKMAGRTLWGVTAMADENRAVAEPLVGTLRLSAAFMGMRFGGVLLGNGSRPGDVRTDARALREAKTFFTREAPLARFPAEA
ncbi:MULTISPECIES: NAD(P)H-dependent oxidoreductase [unclassified Streptomyces]|uniref:NAD(P)H-dependent oxidoreductase n=1 Tax=Streptomyces evansiae TaxID=3075535 RepID=A0ABD5E7L7_9ACTN|nr:MULTISPECIES: NAD(P)H-dependent oxidoreductase [unclassified Streptomyces]ASY32150.1 flavodoxin [Streptomyces sp. CLI2509]EFL03365.1 NAD(P)H dehydrogenase [Streptomyces sp. SPB78]MDT0416653.1 NAD(P)H-dependent oxidoreductase [Streptomyces sp. DSM 41982]MYX25013.1 flavodoxin [Streptomyces sp. SID8380]SCD72432.1 Multimeric flavodoxin WrbA [Streptomyces sp. TverLS-915]